MVVSLLAAAAVTSASYRAFTPVLGPENEVMHSTVGDFVLFHWASHHCMTEGSQGSIQTIF